MNNEEDDDVWQWLTMLKRECLDLQTFIATDDPEAIKSIRNMRDLLTKKTV